MVAPVVLVGIDVVAAEDLAGLSVDHSGRGAVYQDGYAFALMASTDAEVVKPVISIDKATAVSMYDRVQEQWKMAIAKLEVGVYSASGDHKEALSAKLALMQDTDMAVVMSPSQNEITEMADKGLDTCPHRQRMVAEDLATKFKNPEDALRLVFVCAM